MTFLLRKLFDSRFPDYERMGGTLLTHRIKDYIVDILPSIFMDTNALDLLEMVKREVSLMKRLHTHKKERDLQEQE